MLRSATSSACLGLAFAVAARRSRAQLRSLAASVHLHTMASRQLRAMRGMQRNTQTGARARAGHLADGRAVRVHV